MRSDEELSLGVQGAGCEPRHLAISQSGGFGTEIKTFCILFFVNEKKSPPRAALWMILNLSRLVHLAEPGIH